MRCLGASLDISWDSILMTSAVEAQRNHKLARKTYYQQKKNFPEWRTEFNTSLLSALAEEEGVKIAQIKAQMKREKQSREMG